MEHSQNFNKAAYLVLSIGTDNGKTFFVENLCRLFRKNSLSILAVKPISSGFKDENKESDFGRILSSLNLQHSKKNIESITPWRFEEATSPHFAAKNQNTKISFEEVVNFCKEKIKEAHHSGSTLLIEASGGVMTPINNEKTFLDLAKKLKIPIFLITEDYLGSITHTLCAVKALESENIFIEKIIASKNSSDNFIETIENFTGIKTVLMKKFLSVNSE